MVLEGIVRVGCGALIQNNEGKFLFLLRSQQTRNNRGKWGIPGGGVEFGETLINSLKRETREEIGCEIEVGELMQVLDDFIPADNQHWVSMVYRCKIIFGEPKILEPTKFDCLTWFTLDELPANRCQYMNVLIDKFAKAKSNTKIPNRGLK